MEQFEIYRSRVAQGVAGRWSRVYHPKVIGDDAVAASTAGHGMGTRGAIILKHFAKGSVEIFPKGLHPEESYDVRF